MKIKNAAIDARNARFENATLGQIADLYAAGDIGEDEARDYVAAWNAGPHFTQARVIGDSIQQFDKE